MILLKTDNVENWAYSNVFTAQECAEIIELGKKKTLNAATVVASVDAPQGSPNKEYRKSNIAWLTEEDCYDLYTRLVPVVNHVNDNYFNFDLFGFTESLQFTEYTSPGDTYKYHIDKMYKSTVRKLSMVVQLTDPSEYGGGELEILLGETPEKLPKTQGTVIFFPSYLLHRVTPMVTGTRYSLVTWLGGPPFK
jgi:PKHD-type hydroxylase